MMYARGPVVVEKEPNDRPDAPQSLPGPCEVAGKIDKRDDRDWYQFPMKKGEVYTIEVFGDRIGSPADFYFAVKPADPKAGLMGENDDNAEMLHPTEFYTRNSDPQPFRLEAKADGQFLVMVSSRDAGTEYGPRHLYRLRITPEKPDFRLIVMPSTSDRAEGVVARTDGQESFDVFIWRLDGFNSAIELSAEGLPAGVTCPKQTIGPGQKMAALVLNVAKDAAASVTVFTVKGTAQVNGQTLVREGRPATITWSVPPGQNIPTLCRLDRQLGPGRARQGAVPRHAERVDPGRQAGRQDQAELPDRSAVARVQGADCTAGAHDHQQSTGDSRRGVQQQSAAEHSRRQDRGGRGLAVSNQAVPGVYSLVFRCSAAHQYEKVPKGPKVNTGLLQPSLPITLTILPVSLGTLQASMPNANLRPGATGEIVVKVTRTHGYAGEYKLKLILPPGAKGVSAADSVIPAGKDEAKIAVQVAADAKPGSTVQNLVVQAVALFDAKTPITSETKFNGINIVK